MVLANLISCYKTIISKDGAMTKDEIIEALELDQELMPEYKTKQQLTKIADEIMNNSLIFEEQNKCKKEVLKERLSLYEQGLNDYEIADIQRVTQATIFLWRKKNNLPKNPAKKNPIFVEKMEYRMQLYELGYNDKKIGDMTNVSSTTIYMWRKRKKLPSQSKRPMKKQRVKNV